MQSSRQLLAIVNEFTGPRVESAQQSEVIQHVKPPVIDESCRIVGRRQRLAPGDAGVVGLPRLEGNIAAATWPKCINWPCSVHNEARSDVQQSSVRIRCRDGDAGHALEPPKQLALQIVCLLYTSDAAD